MTDRILRNRYQIISELGKGGFGTTYLAVDLDLPGRTKCVVKQLTSSDPRPQVFQVAKDLFKKEAITLQRLGEHNQIPRLFAYFEEGGQFYLVQEFIEGHDLTKEIYSGNFNENRTVQLLIEILEALKYVHRQNAIHRDLKPQNIMRRKSDGKIVLIDFGAVKEIKGLTITSAGLTTTTIAVGTPGYMPDEQAAGKPKFCSDIYAVGMMGIEALSGLHVSQFPKDRSTGEILWKKQVNVSDEFGRVLERMVFDYWKHRYQGVDDAIGELRKIGYGNSPIPQPTIASNTPSPVTLKVSPASPQVQNTKSNKHWGKIILGGIVSVILASFVIPKILEPQLVGDYSKLEMLFAEGKWEEADREAEKIMLQVAGRQREAWLDRDSIYKFPCSELKKINQLWVKYSDGHFGYTVQKPIYLETGNTLGSFKNMKPYQLFGNSVGWYQNENWLTYEQLTFKPGNSPKGHLPAPHRKRTSSGFSPYHYLMDRLIQCGL